MSSVSKSPNFDHLSYKLLECDPVEAASLAKTLPCSTWPLSRQLAGMNLGTIGKVDDTVDRFT